MHQPNVETIAAIATAQGRGGVGVVRISGSNIDALVLGILGKIPVARYATYCEFLDDNGEILDQGIALLFRSPNSFTGENVLELQGHGGSAVLQLVLSRCLDLGARLAQPGEFTKRAFLNGKLDLAQAESVSDLIEANTAEAARSAMRSLHGEFSSAVHDLVDQLIHLRMLVEAMLDFPEEDIDTRNLVQRDQLLDHLRKSLQITVDTAKQGCLLREGARIVIAGLPNVGKSSLLNRLSGEDVALVSEIPGTTRDLIRQEIQIYGIPLHIIDTAGVRESVDVVESMGIERTHQAIQKADLILQLLDASKGITAEDVNLLAKMPQGIPVIQVYNKTDLLDQNPENTRDSSTELHVSAKTGIGIDALRSQLMKTIGWRDQESGLFMARERHIRALTKAEHHLCDAANVRITPELFAEELRLAQESLSEITGEFSPDDLLGEIFSKFCIGK